MLSYQEIKVKAVSFAVLLLIGNASYALHINQVKINQSMTQQTLNTSLTQEDKAIKLLLPLSSSLTLGDIKTHTVARVAHPLPAAVFVISSDATSLKWLSDNYDLLKKKNAIGVVVNIQTLVEFHKIQQAAIDLNLTPLNVDSIAAEYGVTHYPVLINKHEVYQ